MVAALDVRIRDLAPDDRRWAAAMIADGVGVRPMTGDGAQLDPLALPGLVAESGGGPVGIATVRETPERGMEVVALRAEPRGRGAGTALLETAWRVAAASGHPRVWLVTAPDDVAAIHFCLRRGMHVAGVSSRSVELELDTEGEVLGTRRFPDTADLDQLPEPAFAHEVAPLFEGAPRFLAALSRARPFGDDEGMIDAAFEVARGLADGEQVELVQAHAPIGAAPDSVSDASYVEQGYASESDDDRETARAYEELSMLNDIYERRFGFRYVVFVAGRPKTEIVPILEGALRHGDREAELRRAVDETVHIARDRLARLRA